MKRAKRKGNFELLRMIARFGRLRWLKMGTKSSRYGRMGWARVLQ